MPDSLPSSAPQPAPANYRGIFAMLGATAAFVLGDATMKKASEQLPIGEVIFLRGLIAMPIVWYLAYRTRAIGVLITIPKKLLAWRSLGDAGGSLTYMSALARMPFADVGAILQLNPLLVTAGAAIFLKETVGWRRWLATLIGLLGVLLIIQPGSSAFTWVSLVVIASVLFSTMRDLVTRSLPPGMPTVLITATATTSISLGALLFAPFESWQWPSTAQFLMLVFPAVCMLLGQALVVISIRSGDLSAVVPFRYAAILWSLLLSYLIWGYIPDSTKFAGIVIVTIAGLYVFFREQRLYLRNRSAARSDPSTRAE